MWIAGTFSENVDQSQQKSMVICLINGNIAFHWNWNQIHGDMEWKYSEHDMQYYVMVDAVDGCDRKATA